MFNQNGRQARAGRRRRQAEHAGPAFAESAKRAILQCQPYTMLRQENYDTWKDMELTFNPSDMFR